MDDETGKIISDQIAKLPKNIQQALLSFDWASILSEMGKKYQMNIEQMGAFQTETMLVLIGLSHPEDYESELKTRTGLPAETVHSVVAEANERIFKSIRQNLIEFVKKENEAAENEIGKDERIILRKTGIEIANDDGATPETSDAGVPEPSMRPSEILKSIEHPQPTAQLHPFEQKITTTAVTEKKETEYTKEKGPDPYRELPL